MQNVQDVVANALSSHSAEISELRATNEKQQGLIEELTAMVTAQVSNVLLFGATTNDLNPLCL